MTSPKANNCTEASIQQDQAEITLTSDRWLMTGDRWLAKDNWGTGRALPTMLVPGKDSNQITSQKAGWPCPRKNVKGRWLLHDKFGKANSFSNPRPVCVNCRTSPPATSLSTCPERSLRTWTHLGTKEWRCSAPALPKTFLFRMPIASVPRRQRRGWRE